MAKTKQTAAAGKSIVGNARYSPGGNKAKKARKKSEAEEFLTSRFEKGEQSEVLLQTTYDSSRKPYCLPAAIANSAQNPNMADNFTTRGGTNSAYWKSLAAANYMPSDKVEEDSVLTYNKNIVFEQVQFGEKC